MNETFGTTSLITYGPKPTGGLDGSGDIGVVAGMNGTQPPHASTSSKAPYGETRWIVICPVASLLVIPDTVLALPLA
ncbi:MAG: hypothetical protein ABSG43_07195 [Solirubrobacteraceae bacterium]